MIFPLFVIFRNKVFLYHLIGRFFYYFVEKKKKKHFLFWFSHVLRKEFEL